MKKFLTLLGMGLMFGVLLSVGVTHLGAAVDVFKQVGFLYDGGGISGILNIDNYQAARVLSESMRPTYAVSGTAVTPAAAATDIAVLNGSATRTVRLTRCQIQGKANAGLGNYQIPIALIRRNTADSGGTCTAPQPIGYDTASPTATSATATFMACTGNPTVGLAAGTIAEGLLGVTPAISGVAAALTFDFGTRNTQSVVLRGVAQGLAINMEGATIPAGTAVTYWCEWTETTD